MKFSLLITSPFIFSLLLSSTCAQLAIPPEEDDISSMPITMPYENSLEYTWSQKQVLDSKLLSDMESMDAWEHKGGYGTLVLSQEKPYKGNSALLITSPTKGPQNPPEGRPWGTSGAFYRVNNEDWTDWNRISFWIYPDLPGFKVVSISMVFYNDGEDKVPDQYERNGLNYQVLENQTWNKVYWEIAHLGREKVTGIEIRYRLQGNEPGAIEIARYFLDEIYLEKVDPDHFEGWNVSPDQLAYNHAGYANGFPKQAYTPDHDVKTFTLVDNNKRVAFQGDVVTQNTPTGSFHVMDFTSFDTPGTYYIEAGSKRSRTFQIDNFAAVYRSSIIKTINHFYTQRCGFPVEGVHDACHRDWVCRHGDKMLSIHGGWHDAGDLSQGLVNTAEAAYSMLLLAERIKNSDPKLADRLLDEAIWGIDWMLKTRFGDGYRNTWATKDMWTDDIIGSTDDFPSQAQNSPHANFISATTEAAAYRIIRNKNSYMADYALQCAREDWQFAVDNQERYMSVEIAGAALNASLELYEITKEENYKKAAFEYADYIMKCQQTQELASGISLKGFFYRTPEKDAILHYPHRGHEQDAVVGLVRLYTLFPQQASNWEPALRLYANFYKEATAYTAPYYMIPAGIYDLTKARNEIEEEQIRSGIRLNDRYFLKNFPVWGEFRGNSGTILTQAKGLSQISHYLNDKELQNIVYRQLDWHLGTNPFTQSLMYGEGYRYAGQYSVASGNLVGGLPVGVQTHFNRDEPYWPAENCYNWKEIWVHPSCRWLMLMADFI